MPRHAARRASRRHVSGGEDVFERLRGHARLGNLRQHPPRALRPIASAKCFSGCRVPLVTVATPTLNQRRFIDFTLESVVSQGYPRLEYIVQDGGSTDGTQAILNEYQNAGELIYRSEPDSGIAQGINRGFCGSRGDIMAYLNSDDLLLPGCLATVVAWFNAHPDIDVVYGHRVLIDDYGHQIGRWILPPHDREVLKWEDYVPQETLFWRRGIWDRIGAGVDESFQFAVDWDLVLRFASAGARFSRIPRFLGAFRVHNAQKTMSQIDSIGQREVARILERIHGYVPTRREIAHKVAGYILKHHLYDWAYSHGFLSY